MPASSAALGRAAKQPARCTDRAAARWAVAMAGASAQPAARAAASTPQKVSPAPVLSIIRTAGAGSAWTPAAVATRQPCRPSVTIATPAPAAQSAAAAARPVQPVRASASAAFATATAQNGSTGRMSHGRGAVFSITDTPRDLASRQAASVASGPRLPCMSSHPPGGIAARSARAAVSGKAVAQDPAVTMLFSPSGITISTEQSVAGPGRGSSRDAKPSCRRAASTWAPAGSLPSGARNATGTRPARHATTAWFSPLPPGRRGPGWPTSVSPGRGRRGRTKPMSSPALPRTRSRVIRAGQPGWGGWGGRDPPPA